MRRARGVGWRRDTRAGCATGRLATPEEVSNDLASAIAILRKRGFEVTGTGSAEVRPRTRTRAGSASRAPARSATRRASPARDVAPAVCPTCSMTLPATGICDDCG